MTRRDIRLPRMDLAGAGVLKHHAAVFPARNKDTVVMPTHAVEECPEGKDRRPSFIWSCFLQHA